MINIKNIKLLIFAVFISKLNANNICIWRPEAGTLAFKKGLNHICNIDFENEFLDLNELTFIEKKSEGQNLGEVYKDKHENIWFIKESYVFREYVGGNILRFLLGEDRIAKIKLVKGHPSLIASKKVENFQSIETLLERPLIKEDKIYSLLDNNEELIVSMNYIGLSDRHEKNQGSIKKGERLEAARIDYDWSFGSKNFYNRALFEKNVDYNKLEKAIIELLSLPDDQVYQILEKGAYLKLNEDGFKDRKIFEDTYDLVVNYDQLVDFLEERKKNLKQLLPFITFLKKVLNERDINYLRENKDALMGFQNMVEPDSQVSYLNILMHQIVQRGCLEALKKLEELEVYEYNKEGYGFRKEELAEVAYKAEQGELLDYLLEDDKSPLIKTLYTVLRHRDYDCARKLINARSIPFLLDAPKLSSDRLDVMLERSVESNDLNLIKAIVSLDADIRENRSVLYCALESGSSIEMFQYLLQNGATEHLIRRPRFIHEAAWKERADVVNLFVQYGADPYLRDRDGKTAYDYLN